MHKHATVTIERRLPESIREAGFLFPEKCSTEVACVEFDRSTPLSTVAEIPARPRFFHIALQLIKSGYGISTPRRHDLGAWRKLRRDPMSYEPDVIVDRRRIRR